MLRADRTVLVTGATGGLGRVVVKQLHDGGSKVGIVSTSPDRLHALTRDLDLDPGRTCGAVADLCDADQAAEAVRTIDHGLGSIDVALHLVGGWTGGTPIVDLADGDVEEMLEQHLWTTLHVVRAVVPGMLQRRFGRVVCVSSPTATAPGMNIAPFAIGKAAQETLLLALAREVAGSGVTVNVLQVRTIDVSHERDRARTPDNATWTTPEEILAAMQYLASDEARMVNGARIPLHGG
jgi:NAD(P)-dependent dehydrogenase (short-subunit alcohol dehydrogenase family)